MRERSSFNLCSEQETMSALALEMQDIVRNAAMPVRPGDTIKGQMNRAWRALQTPPFWRIKAAWYGEAGCWDGAAIEDMRARDARRRREKERLAREEAALASARVSSLRARLLTTDPEFHEADVPALDQALRAIGRVDADDEPEG